MLALFGPSTEGTYLLSPPDSLKLKDRVISYARSSEFVRKSRIKGAIRRRFFEILSSAEFVGSSAGGAAGYLKLASIPKDQPNPLKLRYALQTNKGLGNLWGMIPLEVVMRHELLHFVREAESVTRRGVSLFEAKKNSGILGRVFLMLREEVFVWLRTVIWF